MLRFRPKLGSERNSEWRCCFCLHVRTGTILLGSWHLILHLVALGFLAVVRNPRLMDELERGSPQVLPTPLANIESQQSAYTQHASQPRVHSLMYMCTLGISMMLIYGAARGKPAHLLPFFCLQVFDFAITVLTATGYLCYLRSIHRLVAEMRRLPWQAELQQLPAPALAFIVLSTFLFSVLIKAYCINMVWRCYKYLTMRTHAMHNMTPFVISSEGIVTAAPPYQPPAPDYSSLLPAYEEAVKQTPPPSYRAATLMTADPAAFTPDTPQAQSPAAQAPPPPAPAPAANTVVMLPQGGDQARL